MAKDRDKRPAGAAAAVAEALRSLRAGDAALVEEGPDARLTGREQRFVSMVMSRPATSPPPPTPPRSTWTRRRARRRLTAALAPFGARAEWAWTARSSPW